MFISALLFSLLTLAKILLLPWYPLHDSTHPMRLTLMQETISTGQFPPLWAYHINQGYGYPLFHFYAPLYHLTSYFFSLFLSNAYALKAALVVFMVILLTGIYQLAKRWGRGAALLSLATAALSPYLALDLYIRGAYAEFAALALFPWVIHSLSRLKPLRSVVFASVTTSAFLLAHNLVPLLAAPIIGIYLLYLKPPLKILIKYIVLTLLLSAFFLGPLLLERHFTHAEAVAKTTAYALHFVEPWQIWDSTWGFGGSVLGIEDGMSFKLGKIQLLLGLGGTLLAISRRRLIALATAGALLFTLFLATPYSRWFWDNLPFLPLVQFPWRSLGLSVIFLSILSGYALSYFRSRIVSGLLALILVSGLIIYNFKYFVPQTSFSYPTEFRDIAPVVPEYLPRWMQTFPSLERQDDSVAYYPTWVAIQDGSRLVTFPDSAGLLRYTPISNSPVTLTHTPTLVQRLSNALTLLGFACCAYILIKTRPKHD